MHFFCYEITQNVSLVSVWDVGHVGKKAETLW